MRVAVAGGTGFLGRSVARRLLADGCEVVVLARGARSVGGAIGVAIDVAGDVNAVAAAIAGCDAVINLVGIKRPTAAQDFVRAHEAAVAGLIAGCAAAGVTRLVHVSVAAAAAGEYSASKLRGEQLVRGSGLAWTIVRPGVIAGPSDDFITNLTAMIRQVPVFPGPDGARAQIQPVHVDDVAAAIAAATIRPAAIGACIDVVGPERLTLRAWVLRVSAALELRTVVVPTPGWLLAPAVAVMERVLAAPPLTRSQLGMLRGGMIGDTATARALLGVEATALTRERVVQVAAGVGPWLGVSLRISPDAEHRGWLRRCAPALTGAMIAAPLAALLIAGLRAATPNIWRCMLAVNVVVIPTALALRLPWAALLRPRFGDLVFGAAAGLVLYGLGWLGAALLRAVSPTWMAEAATLYAWGDVLPVWQALPALALIVAGEELFWRTAIALPVAGRFGPWWGVAASSLVFTLAHLVVGPPVLWLAAAACGAAWAWLVVRTRSVWPGFVCHYVWDVLVMFVAPY